MKQQTWIRLVAWSIVIAMGVTACGAFMPSGGSGSIVLAVAAPPEGMVGNSLSSSEVGAPSYDTVRVWLYQRGREIPGTFREVATSGDGTAVVTIDEVIAGDEYRVVIALGGETSSVFVPSYYGFSETFSVFANQDNGVSIERTVVDTPLTEQIGKNIADIEVVDSEVFYATGLEVRKVPDEGSLRKLPSGSFINSIFASNTSLPMALISTTRGLYEDDDPPEQLLKDGFAGSNVLRAGIFDVEKNTTNDKKKYAIYYEREGGFGGAFVDEDETPSDADWYDISTDELVPGQSGSAQLVLASTSGDKLAYFSTSALGAFAIEKEFFNKNLDADRLLNGTADGYYPFAIAYPGTKTPLRITSLVALGDTGEDSTDILVIGTARGAFLVLSDEVLKAKNNANDLLSEVIPISGDVPVTEVVIGSGDELRLLIGTEEMLYFFTDRDGDVNKPEDLLVLRDSFPRRALTLGESRDIAFSASEPYLWIAGSEGLIGIRDDRFDPGQQPEQQDPPIEE